MNCNLKYVLPVRRGKCTYYYFRTGSDSKGYGGGKVRIRGRYGSPEFMEHYAQLLAQRAPKISIVTRRGFAIAPGTVAWAILQFCDAKNPGWITLSASSKEVYLRSFDWLRERYGDLPMAAFNEERVRDLRDAAALPEKKSQRNGKIKLGKPRPSFGNRTVDKFGQLWIWVKEFRRLKLPANPTDGVQQLHVRGKSAPQWPLELCAAFETKAPARLVTAYMLMRYTGQRKGDICKMQWSDFDTAGRIHVVQEKTGTKIWVPCHKRLREYLAALPHESSYILTSSLGTPYADTSITNQVCTATTELGFRDDDGAGFSPHGLRHLAGASLAEAGCTVSQIMSVLGHLTAKQAQHYTKQASQRVMADDAVELWEAHDESHNREVDAPPIRVLAPVRKRNEKRTRSDKTDKQVLTNSA